MLDLRQVGGESLTSATGSAAGELAIKQFSFREMTIRRFLNHPTAKWAVVVLVTMMVACYGAPLWTILTHGYVQAPDQYSLLDAGKGPSVQHLFGSDSYLGHDILSLILYGGRLSIFIGIGSMVVAVFVGVILGASAGYLGGVIDAVLMRVTDVFLTVPALLLVPLAARVFGDYSFWKIALIFGLLSWPSLARIVRSSFLSLREMQFAEAARALGTSTPRIIFRHLLPNAVGPIVVAFTLGIANNIVLEAFVSFLGFGLQPPTYSWGSTLAGAQGVLIAGNWWWITFPGLAIVATVLCINFIGDGLRDALDPKIIH